MATFAEIKQHMVDKYFHNKVVSTWEWASHFQGERNKIVVHIPARSGSTRIKNKNIIDLCGRPLIAYTIAAAKAMGVDRIIVNTDSKEYAKLAEKYGAEVPFLRPKEYCTDIISPQVASFYALRHMIDENYPVKSMIEMYPTMPFRTLSKSRTFLGKIRKGGHCHTAIPIICNVENLYANGKRLSTDSSFNSSAFYGFRIVSSFTGEHVDTSEILWFEYVLLDNPIEQIDIDTYEDYAAAKRIIDKNIFEFGYDLP